MHKYVVGWLINEREECLANISTISFFIADNLPQRGNFLEYFLWHWAVASGKLIFSEQKISKHTKEYDILLEKKLENKIKVSN